MRDGLVCPEACGAFQTRDRTCVCCTGRWTLYHWTIRKAPRSRCTRRIVPAGFVQSFQGVGGRHRTWLISFLFAGRSGCIQSLAVTRDAATHHLPHTPAVTAGGWRPPSLRKAKLCDEAVEHRLGIARIWVQTPVLPLSARLHLPRDVAEAQRG